MDKVHAVSYGRRIFSYGLHSRLDTQRGLYVARPHRAPLEKWAGLQHSV